MGCLQQDALHAQVHVCSACYSTVAWGVENALGRMKYFGVQQKAMKT